MHTFKHYKHIRAYIIWKNKKKKRKNLPGHHPIGLNAMLKTIELPARIPHLNPSLPNMYAYYLPHFSSSSSSSSSLCLSLSSCVCFALNQTQKLKYQRQM
jgi:hypothetical protein